jgi:hypothetical protein
MADIDGVDAKNIRLHESITPMKHKTTPPKTVFSLRRPTQPLRKPGASLIYLFCDRCGGPFYSNSHRSPLCGVCLRAAQT